MTAIFQALFTNAFCWMKISISINISLKCNPINNIPASALVYIMAWRCPGDKPLSEPTTFSLPTHICVTRPQWVKDYFFFLLVICSVFQIHVSSALTKLVSLLCGRISWRYSYIALLWHFDFMGISIYGTRSSNYGNHTQFLCSKSLGENRTHFSQADWKRRISAYVTMDIPAQQC